jgi:hypothetical protein
MNDKWPGSITVSVGEADQAKIFEEFQQADSLLTRENGTKTETIARARELILTRRRQSTHCKKFIRPDLASRKPFPRCGPMALDQIAQAT